MGVISKIFTTIGKGIKKTGQGIATGVKKLHHICTEKQAARVAKREEEKKLIEAENEKKISELKKEGI